MASSPDPATSFGQAAEAYDRARPGYPAPVVGWLLEGIEGPVMDVGSGTGRLAAALEDHGHEVVAVEPDDGMRALLSQHLSAVDVRPGRAEALPATEGSVSLVTFAQAWHWVDVGRASREAARVLARPGRLALVWNQRDERDPWVKRLGDVLAGRDATTWSDLVRRGSDLVGDPFPQPERVTHEWHHVVDVDTLVDLAASRSYVITRPEPQRHRVLDRVRELGQERADPSGRVTIPYVTYAFRSDLR